MNPWRTAAALLAVVTAGSAHSALIIGSSSGSFTGLSSCENIGASRDCRIVASAYGPQTQVQWGSQSTTIDFVNPSALTSVGLSFNTQTDAVGLAIGRLDWYNSATWRTSSSLDTFGVTWTLAVDFVEPSGPDPSARELFNLSVLNTINPSADRIYGLGLMDLSNLASSFSFNGVSIGNLRYQVVDGAGAGTSGIVNNVWYNDESNLSSLYILADLHATVGPVSSVPEPQTCAMLAMGLGMIVLSRRRRR